MKSVNCLMILPISFWVSGCASQLPLLKVHPSMPECSPASIKTPLEAGENDICMSLSDWSRVRGITSSYCSK